MARSSTPRSTDFSPDDLELGIARLQQRINEVQALDPVAVTSFNKAAVVAPLQAAIEGSLEQTFGNGTIEYRRYEPASRFDQAIAETTDRNPWALTGRVQEHRAHSLALLKQAVASLEERLSEVGVPVLGRLPELPADVSRKVFVVHGQDTGAREAVARFLE